MKKNNTLKVLLIAICVTFLLTWLLPITYYNGGITSDVRQQVGLFDMFNYPTLTLYYFGTTALYVLIVGAFYGVFNKTGVYKKVCDKIVDIFKKRQLLFYAIVVTLLTVIVAFCGFGYELFFVLPLITSVIIMMEHDRITAAMTIIGSIALGYAGSLFANSIVGNIKQSLNIKYTDLIIFKIVILVLGIALLVFNIIRYNKKDKAKKDELSKEFIPEKVEVKGKKGNVRPAWPAILVFDLILFLMIFGAIDFSGAFGVSVFDKFHETVMGVKIANFPIFSKIFGSSLKAIGAWTSSEFMVFMLLGTVVLAIVYKIKLSDLFDDYKEGAKKFGLSALLMLLTYTVLITISNHPVMLTIVKPLLTITDGFNSVTLSIATFISSVFNVDVYYSASALLPYVTSIVEDTSVYPLIGFITQSMHAIATLIAPTSVILLGVLAFLKLEYTKWIKSIWKFVLELFLLCFVLFIIILVI